MMINRHNYEEFFLLYADGELNHQHRAEVELFVKQNPDMAAELEILQQIKLQPEEHIVFPDKTTLFKTTDVEINTHNYEEFFLLYIDRELDERASAKVEKFVLQHPQLQGEFTLLKQTVLQPEAITFADKSSLYRREERKVGFMRFARLAAAAAVIGLVLLGWWLYPKTTTAGQIDGVAKSTPAVRQSPPVVILPKQQTIVKPREQEASKDATADINPGKKQDKALVPVQMGKDSMVPVQQQPIKPAVGNLAQNVTNSNHDDTATAIITRHDVGTLSGTASQTNPTNAVPVTALNTVKPTTGEIKQPADTVATSAKPDLTTVAYRELNTDEDDHSMYVGSLQLNKDKIKGFFRRAGRIFGAKPKKDVN